jgi:beta-phosphoglucomutase-like phosphatase (HAD superfamily)
MRALAIAMVGRNWPDCTALVRERYGTDYPVDALCARWHAAYDGIVAREGLQIKPGALELIEWLERHAIPARRRDFDAPRAGACEARAHGIAAGDFRDIVGGDEVARGKPEPDIYVEAARRLGVHAADCVALEDSAPGVRAALAAGMTAIMVPDMHAPPGDLLVLEIVVLPVAASRSATIWKRCRHEQRASARRDHAVSARAHRGMPATRVR